jgi:hypothetical protein
MMNSTTGNGTVQNKIFKEAPKVESKRKRIKNRRNIRLVVLYIDTQAEIDRKQQFYSTV